MNWYEENIEEPIRGIVKILRNNGFNTECSCGHEMYIQCQYIPEGSIQRLHELLYERYKNYKIEVIIECINGSWISNIIIDLKGNNV